LPDLLLQPPFQLLLVLPHVEVPVSTLHLLLGLAEAGVGVKNKPLVAEDNLLGGTMQVSVTV